MFISVSVGANTVKSKCGFTVYLNEQCLIHSVLHIGSKGVSLWSVYVVLC